MLKSSNPSNIAHIRPIENFCLGQKVYEKGWLAKSHDQLVPRIESKLKVFELNYLQSLMKRIPSKLRNIADSFEFRAYKKPNVRRPSFSFGDDRPSERTFGKTRLTFGDVRKNIINDR